MEHLMQQLFDFLSAAGREVALFIVSMVPLIELRGSIPLGAALGMPWYTVFLISIVGNRSRSSCCWDAQSSSGLKRPGCFRDLPPAMKNG